jgi:hypothetical protein
MKERPCTKEVDMAPNSFSFLFLVLRKPGQSFGSLSFSSNKNTFLIQLNKHSHAIFCREKKNTKIWLVTQLSVTVITMAPIYLSLSRRLTQLLILLSKECLDCQSVVLEGLTHLMQCCGLSIRYPLYKPSEVFI